MMGIPGDQYDMVLANSNIILSGDDPEFLSEDMDQAVIQLLGAGQALADLVTGLAAERAQAPREDLVSALVTANIDGEQLTSAELASFFILLVVAGNETTRNALSHALTLFTQFPGQRALLLEDMDNRLAAAVEEIVRYASPVVFMRRTLTQDYTMNGQDYRKDDKVALYYYSANRDAEVFPDPDRAPAAGRSRYARDSGLVPWKTQAMTDLGELKIPAATRAPAEAIIALTDHVCLGLLDEEYAGLARRVVAKLARKRPSPIQSGRASTWAGAVVYALGQVNFLFDSATKPYATADDLSAAFGVAKSTLGAKAKQVRDLTKMHHGTPEFLRDDVVDASPMIWFIQVDGMIMDARELPPPIQAQAFALGVIPYIPALGRDGTAAWLSENGRA